MSFMNQDPGSELEPGQHLGHYRLEELLGEGGMGLVFRAVRETDGAVVALKVMRFELIEDRSSAVASSKRRAPRRR